MARKPNDPGGPRLTCVDPATLEVLGEVPWASAADVRAAIGRAEAAGPAWAAIPVAERAARLLAAREWLLANADEVCALVSKEVGKPRVEALAADVFPAADLITRYADRAADVLADRELPLANPLLRAVKSSRLVREPFGVVAVVSSWNYPLASPLSAIVFALLAGNTVVFKPSSRAALCGLKIDEMMSRGANLPRGVFNTVVTPGECTGALLCAPPVGLVAYSGGPEAAAAVRRAAAPHGIPVQVEATGLDAFVVCSDADVELAARGVAWAGLTNAGQSRGSPGRVFVDAAVADRFVDALVRRVERLRVGSDRDLSADLGPVIGEDRLARLDDLVRDALTRGARIATGGRRIRDLPGFFFEPTVIVDADPSMRLLREPSGGPVLSVVRVPSDDEAIRLANDCDRGLSVSIWTRSRARAADLSHRADASIVSVNDHGFAFAIVESPWRGRRLSGEGVVHGDDGLRAYTREKHVCSDRAPAFLRRLSWWFPYSRAAWEVRRLAVRTFFDPRQVPGLLRAIATGRDLRGMFD